MGRGDAIYAPLLVLGLSYCRGLSAVDEEIVGSTGVWIKEYAILRASQRKCPRYRRVTPPIRSEKFLHFAIGLESTDSILCAHRCDDDVTFTRASRVLLR